ncbi:hypothetical protein AVEN_246458-1 [Araneus ventricosus]|uniref:Uncharacterized protein n=1 Tax=Araneus ventricosus TaxID=182803 RepID=A0A4Y2EP02_ARAVE|nr:hypothetical protein AVEN_246458-1 [Araneus ventricosus]
MRNGSSVESGFQPGTLQSRSRDFNNIPPWPLKACIPTCVTDHQWNRFSTQVVPPVPAELNPLKACIPTCVTDHQWNRVSSQVPSSPEAEALTLSHCGLSKRADSCIKMFIDFNVNISFSLDL